MQLKQRIEAAFQGGKTTDQSQHYGSVRNVTCFLSCMSSGQISLYPSACDQFPSVSFQTTSKSVIPLIFSCFSRVSPVRTSLIPAMVVNGCPVCTPPALPALKLPVGYYRDVFRNAVYASLSSLSLTAIFSPFSTPQLPSPSKSIFFLILLSFIARCSLLHLPLQFITPFFPLSKPHFFVI